jgi:thymidylate synthase (FAD)
MKQVMEDGIGFVERLEVFGSDLTVVNSARVSFGKEVTEMTDRDEKLISYLAKHDHNSPFFHPQIRFRIKMPIFVAREWYRHTIGFARNEVSRRYVDTPPECWVPSYQQLRERDPKAKQGSKETPVNEVDTVYQIFSDATANAEQTYKDLLQKGVAPEIARAILPQSMYTEFIETASLYAYARLCSLRLGPGAQKEIKDYAQMVHNALSEVFPASWKALSAQFAGEKDTTTQPTTQPTTQSTTQTIVESVSVPNGTSTTIPTIEIDMSKIDLNVHHC